MNDGTGSEPDKPKPQAYERVGDLVRIFKRGSKWYANYQMDGRQQRRALNTPSLKQARRLALMLEADILAGRFKACTEVATVAEATTAYKEYLRTEKRAPRTIAKYDMVLNRMENLANELKAKTLDRLNLAFVDRYRAMRVKSEAAPKTIYGESVIIRQLVNFALTRDMVFQDPLKGIKLKKPKPAPQPCWTLEQVRQILAAAPDYARPALTLLAETGMRFGEMAWLTWDDIDQENNLLLIRPKDEWKPKTGDRRSIPISPTAAGLLATLPRRARWVLTMPATKQRPVNGRQWTERRLLSALKKVLGKLKLPGKVHTFRHFFISNALMSGIPTATVRVWVGHVDDEIINLYTHVHDGASQAAMQRLAEANNCNRKQDNAKETANGTEADSAQFQHNPKEASDV